MKIGIDGIVLRGRDAGSLRYIEQLLAGLAEIDLLNEYVIFVNRRVLPTDVIPRKASFACKSVNTPNFIPGVLRQQFFYSWNAMGKLDLLHCPGFVPPLLVDCPTVMTVFDLTFKLYPQTMKWTGRLWFRLLATRGIAKSSRIIALSESTKRDLVNYHGVADDIVKVVYPCTRAIFQPSANSQEVAAKYNLPDKYILYVGTLERRKNIANLIRAYAEARRAGALEHRLVLCGKRGWLYEDIFQTIEELELGNRVILLGYVPDEDLPGLYSGADLFVYLSRFEGFGLPVLEAMACGTPVLTSNSSSLPEVVGEAGITVHPDDVERAAAEMTRILSDQELRGEMVEQGLRRAKLFSRERFIRQTLQVYAEVG